jgi:hypothetical protein
MAETSTSRILGGQDAALISASDQQFRDRRDAFRRRVEDAMDAVRAEYGETHETRRLVDEALSQARRCNRLRVPNNAAPRAPVAATLSDEEVHASSMLLDAIDAERAECKALCVPTSGDLQMLEHTAAEAFRRFVRSARRAA